MPSLDISSQKTFGTTTSLYYGKKVSPYIQRALVYLKLILDGRQWIANLQASAGEPIVSP
jgi:hypothetical protein